MLQALKLLNSATFFHVTIYQKLFLVITHDNLSKMDF